MNNFATVSNSNAHEKYSSVTGCGLPPMHPLRERSKVPQKWAMYDRKKKIHDACVEKKISLKPAKRIKRKARRHEVLHDVNKFNPGAVIVRGAYLSILDINLVGIAEAFALVKDAPDKKHWNQIVEKWKILGGEEEGLAKNIEKGRNKKPLFKELLNRNKKNGVDGTFNNAGGENAGKVVAGASAGMGLITGVLAAVPEPSGTTKAAALWTGIGSTVTASMAKILNSFAKENGASASDIKSIPTPSSDPNLDAQTIAALKESDDTIMGIPKVPFVLGAIVFSGLAITISILAYKKIQ